MPNKSLGQHWLKDRLMLEAIADSADIRDTDTVLEIGPGLGTLTSVLLKKSEKVVAVEYDADLAGKLPGQFPGKNLQVVQADFLTFDLGIIPAGYKVVANVPYYITQKILERFLETDNKPEQIALLIQQEVAEKLAASPGGFTAIAAKMQSLYTIHLGIRVPKEYFTPVPKVDSQVVICKKNHVGKNAEHNQKLLFRVINAGFSAPRKKLITALSGGLGISKDAMRIVLEHAQVSAECRAADVSVSDWGRIARFYDTV